MMIAYSGYPIVKPKLTAQENSNGTIRGISFIRTIRTPEITWYAILLHMKHSIKDERASLMMKVRLKNINGVNKTNYNKKRNIALMTMYDDYIGT